MTITVKSEMPRKIQLWENWMKDIPAPAKRSLKGLRLMYSSNRIKPTWLEQVGEEE